jgi:cell division inhibitor SepF
MNRLVSMEVSVVQRNARDRLGLVERDGYASQGVGEVQDYDETPSGRLAMGNDIQIAIVRPRNFRDAVIVGEYYRQAIPVIINLEDMDNADATRIIDFASGLILGLRGDLERLSRRAFLIVPAGATLITAHESLTDEGFFNQALGRQATSRRNHWILFTSSSSVAILGAGTPAVAAGLSKSGSTCRGDRTSRGSPGEPGRRSSAHPAGRPRGCGPAPGPG